MADQTPNAQVTTSANEKAAAEAKAKVAAEAAMAAEAEAKAKSQAEDREKAEKAKIAPKKTSGGVTMYRLKTGKHRYRNAAGEAVVATAKAGDFIPLTADQVEACKDRIHLPMAEPVKAEAEADDEE